MRHDGSPCQHVMIGNEYRWGIGWKVILLNRMLRGVCVVIGACDYCLFTELDCNAVPVKMELLGAIIVLFSSWCLFNYSIFKKCGVGCETAQYIFGLNWGNVLRYYNLYHRWIISVRILFTSECNKDKNEGLALSATERLKRHTFQTTPCKCVY